MRARPAWTLPCTAFAHQPYSLLDLPRIRIALFDQAHRQSMRAEDQVNARAIRELPQHRADSLHHRLDVQRMTVELANGMFFRAAVGRRAIYAPPLLQAA